MQQFVEQPVFGPWFSVSNSISSKCRAVSQYTKESWSSILCCRSLSFGGPRALQQKITLWRLRRTKRHCVSLFNMSLGHFTSPSTPLSWTNLPVIRCKYLEVWDYCSWMAFYCQLILTLRWFPSPPTCCALLTHVCCYVASRTMTWQGEWASSLKSSTRSSQSCQMTHWSKCE